MKKLLPKQIWSFFCGSRIAKTFADGTAIILLCALTTKPVLAQVPNFTDVDADVYAKEIQEAVETGLIVGFSTTNTFRPTLELGC